jgi:hypothetical protein
MSSKFDELHLVGSSTFLVIFFQIIWQINKVQTGKLATATQKKKVKRETSKVTKEKLIFIVTTCVEVS